MTSEEKVHLDLPSSWISIALVIGVVGVVGCAVASIGHGELFFRAYLVAYTPCLAICLGCLVLGLIGYLTTATWSSAFEPVLESATKVLPLLALLFLPVVFGLKFLYPWAAEGVQTNPEPMLVAKVKYYLYPEFFIIRAVIYFVLWNVVALMVRTLATRGGQRFAEG